MFYWRNTILAIAFRQEPARHVFLFESNTIQVIRLGSQALNRWYEGEKNTGTLSFATLFVDEMNLGTVESIDNEKEILSARSISGAVFRESEPIGESFWVSF